MVASIVLLAVALTTALGVAVARMRPGSSTSGETADGHACDQDAKQCQLLEFFHIEPNSAGASHPASRIRAHPAHPARPDMRRVSLTLDLVEVDAQIDQAIRELEAAERQLHQRH